MRIEVLLFAAVRDAAGSETLTIDFAEPPSAADVIRSVGQTLPSVAGLMPACRVAVDSQYVGPDEIISADSEVALIPPVSGG